MCAILHALLSTDTMSKAKTPKKGKPKEDAAGAPQDAQEDDTDFRVWFECSNLEIDIESLNWDLDCMKGQSRSLDPAYVEELETSVIDNPLMDNIQCYVWNAGLTGMYYRSSCRTSVYVALVYANHDPKP